MSWQAFLQKTLTASATAAAGSAATAITANPVLGAAAGAAARKSTEQLLAEFLPAQQEALGTLVEQTRGIEKLLGSVQSDLRTMMDRDWQAAHLSIADAAKHPERAHEELHVARRRLFDAWGGANSYAKRSQVSQELSVVYGLLGEPDDSHEWLFQAYSEETKALADSINQTWEATADLPRIKVRRKPGGLDDLSVWIYLSEKEQLERDGGLYVGEFKGCVSADPLMTALDALAETRVALVGLRFACAIAQMPRPWDKPEGVDVCVFGRSPSQRGISVYAGSQRLTFLVEKPAPMRAVELLNEIVHWWLNLAAPPGKSPQVFVTGSSPELGSWHEELAVPLERLSDKQFNCALDVYDHDRSDPVEYKYLCLPKPGAPAIWERGKTRRLKPATLYSDGRTTRFTKDSWRVKRQKPKKRKS